MADDLVPKIRDLRIAYSAQSAAAAFNPSHRIIDQVMEMPLQHGLMKPDEATAWA